MPDYEWSDEAEELDSGTTPSPLAPLGFVSVLEAARSWTLYGRPEGPASTAAQATTTEEWPEPTSPSGGVIFEGDMPSLEDLLRRYKVSIAILETPTREVKGAEGVAWTALLVLGVIWGVLTTLAFQSRDFWLHPATGIMGIVALVVLGVTVALHGTDSRVRTGGAFKQD